MAARSDDLAERQRLARLLLARDEEAAALPKTRLGAGALADE
ncbi:MAG TPA: hypothetical protein VFW96_00825 [Thermomicrobiales bacterium]|nr:hypothetical protein [Thermomicrobiales bacterium]